MIGNILLLTAAVAANAYIAGKVVQGPSFDYKFALPESGSVAQDPTAQQSPAQDPQLPQSSDTVRYQFQNMLDAKPDQRVTFTYRHSDPKEAKLISTSFHSSKAVDVLAWLERQGVSFVISDDQLKTKTITMNIVNKPLSETIDSLALALGGHWIDRNSIRIFEPGTDPFSIVHEVPFSGDAVYQPFHIDAVTPAGNNLTTEKVIVSGDVPTSVQLRGKSINMSQFISSITARQRDILGSKGFLDRTDLTADQILQLGLKSGEHLEIIFEINKDKIKIINR